jgi:hypothetical protein
LLRWLNKGADGLISLSALVGTLGLLVEVVVILTDVVGRYFGKPLSGAQDITQMAMVIVVFGGMALCDKIGPTQGAGKRRLAGIQDVGRVAQGAGVGKRPDRAYHLCRKTGSLADHSSIISKPKGNIQTRHEPRPVVPGIHGPNQGRWRT